MTFVFVIATLNLFLAGGFFIFGCYSISEASAALADPGVGSGIIGAGHSLSAWMSFGGSFISLAISAGLFGLDKVIGHLEKISKTLSDSTAAKVADVPTSRPEPVPIPVPPSDVYVQGMDSPKLASEIKANAARVAGRKR